MYKNAVKMMFGLALAVAGAVLPAQAGVITQEFWGLDANNQNVKFGTLLIEEDSLVLDAGNYVANVWKSFTLFGVELVPPTAPGGVGLFQAIFDKNNLQAGFDFLTFDLSDPAALFVFNGFFDRALGVSGYDLFAIDANGDFDGFLIDSSSITTQYSFVNAPATAGLLVLGLFAMHLRRRRAS